jgi:hypothetical protein
MLTKEEFDRLGPRSRGYAVYMMGSREDQPHVPDESNPFEYGSFEWEEWRIGQQKAVLEAQDSEA